jgi:Phosphatidylglycerophosphate synthase
MMNKVLVNAITGLRVLLTVAIVSVIMMQGKHLVPITILFVLIGLSDFIDGKLARKLGVATKNGAIFDVIADLFYITSTTGILIYRGMMPGWFLLVIGGKFLEFLLTSNYMKTHSKSEDVFISDKLGRGVAIMFYGMPYVSLVAYGIVPILCSIIAILSTCSSFHRVRSCLSFVISSKKATDLAQYY